MMDEVLQEEEQVISLPETQEETITLDDYKQGVPIHEAEMTAVISALAHKRLQGEAGEGQDPEQVLGRYYNMSMDNKEADIRSELTVMKHDEITRLVEEETQEAAQFQDMERMTDAIDLQIGFDHEKEALTIIEREAAVELNQAGYSDPVRADVATADALNTPLNAETPDERREARLAEQIYTSTQLLKRLERVKEGGQYGEFLEGIGVPSAVAPFSAGAKDVLFMVTPGTSSWFNSQNIKTHLNPILPGNDLAEQKAEWDMMSLEEKNRVGTEVNEKFDSLDLQIPAMIWWSYMNDFTSTDKFIENAMPIAEVLAFIPSLIKGGKALANIETLRKSIESMKALKVRDAIVNRKPAVLKTLVGDREGAAEIVVATEAAVEAGQETKNSAAAIEAGELMMDAQMFPALRTIGPGISPEIKAATKEFIETSSVKMIPEGGEAPILAKAQADWAADMVDSPVVDIAMHIKAQDKITEAPLQTPVYHVTYGNIHGKGFSTPEAAEKVGNLLSLDGKVVTQTEENGVHYIRTEMKLSGIGDYIEAYTGSKPVSKLRRIFGSTTNYVGKVQATTAHLVAAAREGTIRASKRLTKFQDALDDKEFKHFSAVLDEGRNAEVPKWFTHEELVAKGLNQKQIDAYAATAQMDDIADYVDNSVKYVRLDRDNYKTLSFRGDDKFGKFTGKIIEGLDNPKNKSIYDAQSGEFLTPERLDKLGDTLKKGYSLIQLDGSMETSHAYPVQYILTKADDLKIQELAWRQTVNVPGGRIGYQEQVFVKYGKIMDGPSGQPIALRAHTFGVGTAEEAKKYINSAEETLDIYRLFKAGTITETEASRRIGEASAGSFRASSVWDIRPYIYDAKTNPKGVINLNQPLKFEALRDGEKSFHVNKMVNEGLVSATAEDLNEANTVQRILNNKAKHRGERLKDFTGNEAPLIDPVVSAQRSLDRASSMMSMSTWKDRHAEQFLKTFGGILKPNQGKTAMGHLTDPVFADDLGKDGDKLISQAMAMRQHVGMVMGVQSKDERFIQGIIQDTVSFLNPALRKMGMSESRQQKIADFNPIQFSNHVTYHSKLGLGNIQQPLVQVQATVAMMTMEPVLGAQGAALTGPLRLMLLNDNAKTLAHVGKTAAKAVSSVLPNIKGDEIIKLKEFLEQAHGWRLGAKTLDVQDGTNAIGARTRSWRDYRDKALEVGQMPFIGTEQLNKIAAFSTSWLKTKAANGGKIPTKEQFAEIAQYGEVLTASMGAVDKAAWQNGIAGMFFKFYGHQARMVELMAPKTIGGSEYITTGQKWRLALGQLALYGAGGTLAAETGMNLRYRIADMYKEATGTDIPLEFLNFVEKGAIDGLLFGGEVDMRSRVGLGLFKQGMLSIFSDPEHFVAFKGATIDTMSKAGVGVVNVARALNGLGGQVATPDGLKLMMEVVRENLRPVISTLNVAEKTAIALRLGEIKDNEGATLVSDLSTGDAVLFALGITPVEVNRTRNVNDYVKSKTQGQTKNAKYITKAITEFYKDLDNPNLQKQLQVSIDFWAGTMASTDAERQAILKKAYKNAGKNAWVGAVSKLIDLEGEKIYRELQNIGDE